MKVSLTIGVVVLTLLILLIVSLAVDLDHLFTTLRDLMG